MTHRANVLVSSNCQTAGIALALKALLPDHQVTAHHLVAIKHPNFNNLKSSVESCDIWITSSDKPEILSLADASKTIRIPHIIFDAFHPDITYVTRPDKSSVSGVFNADYHSFLALWSFKNSLNIEESIRLFSEPVFKSIGYLDRYQYCTQSLRERFKNSDLNFDNFFSTIVQHAPFMHSLNHPSSVALNQIGKMVAAKILNDDTVLDRNIDLIVHDILGILTVWPVYPEIGRQYGIIGEYIWKFDQHDFICSLENFLEATFAWYAENKAHDWVPVKHNSVEIHQTLLNLAGK